MAETIAHAYGRSTNSESHSTRLGSRQSQGEANTFKTFACVITNADGSGKFTLDRRLDGENKTRLAEVSYGPEKREDSAEVEITAADVGEKGLRRGAPCAAATGAAAAAPQPECCGEPRRQVMNGPGSISHNRPRLGQENSVAETIAHAYGRGGNTESHSTRLGSRQSQGEANTFRTFACVITNADGSGKFTLDRRLPGSGDKTRLAEVSFGPERRRDSARVVIPPRHEGSDGYTEHDSREERCRTSERARRV